LSRGKKKTTRRIHGLNSEKAGIRTGSSEAVTVPKTRNKRKNRKNKQAKPRKVPAKWKGDGLCITVDWQYGVKHKAETNKEAHRHTDRHVKKPILFFSVQRRMASARSFNMFQSM